MRKAERMARFMHMGSVLLSDEGVGGFVGPRHCCLLLSFVSCAHAATAQAIHPGFLQFSASANHKSPAGTVAVTEAAVPCTYTVSPRSQSVGPAGGAVTIEVTSPVGCKWSASEQTSWISITAGATGTGSGTVTLTVAGNTGTQPRSASVTVADRTVMLSQRSSAPPRPPTGMRIVK